MIVRSASLEKVCGVTSALPDPGKPMIAFAGRSNVGKSSLINCLVRRKALARTSSEPGKTQTINYYLINGEMYFVDLPGYGYAKVGRAEREAWGRMTERFLLRSKDLKAVLLLVDIRHDPTEDDKAMYSWILSRGFRPVVIATKADKLKRSRLAPAYRNVRQALGLKDEDPCIVFSARTGAGREEILELAGQFAEGQLTEPLRSPSAPS